jgi:halocyanin-like protein
MYMNRRDFVRTAGGVAGVTAATTGTAAAQESPGTGGGTTAAGGQGTAGTPGGATGTAGGGGGGGGGGGTPDLGGYLSDVQNYGGSVTDMRGQATVTVDVGVPNGPNPYGFGPPAIHVDNGATVEWNWTGDGGAHNVVHEDGAFDSGTAVSTEGVNFEHTFEEDGVYQYYCNPHKGSGMKGVVVVGTEYPTVEPGGGEEKELHEMGVPFQAHFVGLATILAILVTLVFTFFQLKYGESSHFKGGNS